MRLYNPLLGVDDLLNKIDFLSTSRRQVYWAVLDRLPENPRAALAEYSPRLHYKEALQSYEFQSNLLKLFLSSYPEKRRLVFIHVPRCAGSDFTSLLVGRYPSFNMRITEPSWYSSERMLAELKKLVDDISYSNDVFIYGHNGLQQFLSEKTIRFGDRAMGVVRRPLDMVISHINYILTRFQEDPQLESVDTRDWLNFLDRDRIKHGLLHSDFRGLASSILWNPHLVEPNRICQHLGSGTAETAFDACALADIELTHVSKYCNWLSVRWGIQSYTRTNISQSFVSEELFDSQMLKYAFELNVEDNKFVSRIENLLEKSDSSSLTGSAF